MPFFPSVQLPVFSLRSLNASWKRPPAFSFNRFISSSVERNISSFSFSAFRRHSLF